MLHYKTGGTGHLYQGRFKSFPDPVRRTSADGFRDTSNGIPYEPTSLTWPKNGNGVPLMLAEDLQTNAAGWLFPMIPRCRETGVRG
ncbi:MAG: hypothetical protein R3C17_05230 [Planctomycetaceae bacterium]